MTEKQEEFRSFYEGDLTGMEAFQAQMKDRVSSVMGEEIYQMELGHGHRPAQPRLWVRLQEDLL